MNNTPSFNELSSLIQGCTRCGLRRGIRNYVVGIEGTFRRDIVLLGEAPGFTEDLEGKPFVGVSGKKLTESLASVFKGNLWVGANRAYEHGDFTILNTVMCRPPFNREPTIAEKARCYYWLRKRLTQLMPSLIITLGVHASQAVTRLEYTRLKDFRHNYYICKNTKAVVVPTFHPAATIYTRAREKEFIDDLISIRDGSYVDLRQPNSITICHTSDTYL